MRRSAASASPRARRAAPRRPRRAPSTSGGGPAAARARRVPARAAAPRAAGGARGPPPAAHWQRAARARRAAARLAAAGFAGLAACRLLLGARGRDGSAAPRGDRRPRATLSTPVPSIRIAGRRSSLSRHALVFGGRARPRRPRAEALSPGHVVCARPPRPEFRAPAQARVDSLTRGGRTSAARPPFCESVPCVLSPPRRASGCWILGVAPAGGPLDIDCGARLRRL